MIASFMSGKPLIEADVRLRQEASQSPLFAQPLPAVTRNSAGLRLRDQDLFLAQEIEVLVTTGTRIDDGGKVPGKIVGVTAVGNEGKSKGDLQRDLGRADEFAVLPGLPVNRDFTARGHCIQERLAIASKNCTVGYCAGKLLDAFSIGDGDLVDSSLFSRQYDTKQVLAVGVDVRN